MGCRLDQIGAGSVINLPVVAIDGPAGSGKSTIARGVADRTHLRYIDTGAMYRAVALLALRRGVDVADEWALAQIAALAIALEQDDGGSRMLVDGEDITSAIRTPEVERSVPLVSRHASVRRALVARQRQIAVGGGVVMDGRDIGTVVLPDADVKLFITADRSVRAERRCRQMARHGVAVDCEQVLADLAERDRLDSERATGPLVPAEDCVIIDTTHLDVREALSEVFAKCPALERFATAPLSPEGVDHRRR